MTMLMRRSTNAQAFNNKEKEKDMQLPTRTLSKRKRKPRVRMKLVSARMGLIALGAVLVWFAVTKLFIPMPGGVQYHMVFSTSCSAFQDWQAFVFFYSAWKVKQSGTVTRIVSGCTPEQVAATKKLHEEQITVLSKDFHVHFTPEFSGPENGKDFHKVSKYFNKPFGLLHYMENVLGYPSKSAENDDSIIMIVDPDMILLRPLKHTFHGYPKEYWRVGSRPIESVVRHGFPIAQAYGYGNGWLRTLDENVTHVTGPNSPVLNVSMNDAALYYPAGPPYLATARDMYSIATHWVDFLPRIRDIFPQMMAEMHGYSTAAAHLKLPHQLSEKFMISDTGVEKEGWDFLNDVSRRDACVPNIAEEKLPMVLHYCQRYALGRWFIGKYKVPENLFTCEAPLLRVPPRDVGEQYDW